MKYFQKTKLKPYHYFYMGFFLLYFFVLYYFLYYATGLSAFQANIHYFSNIVGSLSKRFLVEASPYALLFYLLFYAKKRPVRIALTSVFIALFLINVLTIGYYSFIRINWQLYVLKGFSIPLLFSYLTPQYTVGLLLLLVMTGYLVWQLMRIQNTQKVWLFKKRFFIGLLALMTVLSPLIPIVYSTPTSLIDDRYKKAFSQAYRLERSGLDLLFSELKFNYLPSKRVYKPLNPEEEALIESIGLNSQNNQILSNPPKKIILVVVESLDQKFVSRYNPKIPDSTPRLDSLLEKYPHLDEYYPSGSYTLHGLSAMLCGHTNVKLTNKNRDYDCAPKLLANAGYANEFIRGASKYYVGENVHFKKYGFDRIFAKEEFEEKFPDFKKDRPSLYRTWGYSDNYVFNEAIERLKEAEPDDKLFLTLLTVDTHIDGGRCSYEKTDQDPENRMLFSIECFDRVFGEFMDNLNEEGLLTEETVILLSADHLYPGFNQVPGSEFKISFALQPAKIPLLMVSGADIDLVAKQGSQIDIAATLLDLANIKTPSYYMGKSLISNRNPIPMGQNLYYGYMIADGFIPISLAGNTTVKEKGSTSVNIILSMGSGEELKAIAEQKIAEHEQMQNQQTAFYKWYYNKFFNLTGGGG